MKEIWNNLELYTKRYDFYNLGNFFHIFLDLFATKTRLKLFPIWERVYVPYKSSGIIYPTILFFLFRVGLIHTRLI